jgi:hypothetical protein
MSESKQTGVSVDNTNSIDLKIDKNDIIHALTQQEIEKYTALVEVTEKEHIRARHAEARLQSEYKEEVLKLNRGKIEKSLALILSSASILNIKLSSFQLPFRLDADYTKQNNEYKVIDTYRLEQYKRIKTNIRTCTSMKVKPTQLTWVENRMDNECIDVEIVNPSIGVEIRDSLHFEVEVKGLSKKRQQAYADKAFAYIEEEIVARQAFDDAAVNLLLSENNETGIRASLVKKILGNQKELSNLLLSA